MEPPCVAQAFAFARERHNGQRRRDRSSSPFIVHPLEVKHLLLTTAGVTDPKTLAAALLHDLLEDTRTTGAEIEERFGSEVRSLVEALTDDPHLSREARHRRQEQGVLSLALPALLIKLADKTSNIRDLGADSPLGWSRERKLDYLAHAARVAGGCAGSSPALFREFARVHHSARAAVERSIRHSGRRAAGAWQENGVVCGHAGL